jgi:hypothetical protein
MSNSSRAAMDCPACVGIGRTCCNTWAMVLVNAESDIVFSVGLPHWPLMDSLEMNFCPFCGKKFRFSRDRCGVLDPRKRRGAFRKVGLRLASQ